MCNPTRNCITHPATCTGCSPWVEQRWCGGLGFMTDHAPLVGTPHVESDPQASLLADAFHQEGSPSSISPPASPPPAPSPADSDLGIGNGRTFYIRGMSFADMDMYTASPIAPPSRADVDLEARKAVMNRSFGFRPWASLKIRAHPTQCSSRSSGHLQKRSLSERSPAVQSLYEPVTHIRPYNAGQCLA